MKKLLALFLALLIIAAMLTSLSGCIKTNTNETNKEINSSIISEETVKNDDCSETTITLYKDGTLVEKTIMLDSKIRIITVKPDGTVITDEIDAYGNISSFTVYPDGKTSDISDESEITAVEAVINADHISNDITDDNLSADFIPYEEIIAKETDTLIDKIAEPVSLKPDDEVVTKSADTQTPSSSSSEEITTVVKSSGTTYVTLNGNSASVNGSGISVNGGVITIIAGGTYSFSGTLSDGRIIVNAPKTDVTVILNGVNITCSYGSPVYIYKSKLTTVKLEAGSSNTITDGLTYTFADTLSSSAEEEPNACFYSKSDLVINGSGKLVVNANYNNGITSKDTLQISNATLSVMAKNHGINGKDSNLITNANITVNCGGDAVRSTNDIDTALGYITISNSTMNLTAGEDGIQAEVNLTVSSGTYIIKTGGGSSANIAKTASAKGLKAGANITVSGGTFTIDSADDGIHSNGTISILNADIKISTGDDGIHADKELNVKSGNINITKSYEGLESSFINISGGTINIISSDDGINAGGGDGSGMGGRFGNDRFNNSSNSYAINISGGHITITSGGDGIDSNGDITMTGGTLLINGPTSSGDGAIDYDGTFNLSGGTIIAAGSSGMAEAPSASSSQPSVRIYYASIQIEGTIITLKSADGKTVTNYTPTKNYQSVVISTTDMKIGSTYSLYSNNTKLCDLTVSSSVTSISDNGSEVTGGGGRGGIGGGRGGRQGGR